MLRSEHLDLLAGVEEINCRKRPLHGTCHLKLQAVCRVIGNVGYREALVDIACIVRYALGLLIGVGLDDVATFSAGQAFALERRELHPLLAIL